MPRKWLNDGMIPVFVDKDLTRVGFAKDILDAAGIHCFVQNENTRSLGVSVLGFSNPALLDPTLYVTDEAQLAQAQELLKEHFPVQAAAGADWSCPVCKETNPATFEVCWKCQSARPL